MTALTDNQLERYARHVILDEVGEAGQEKLLASSVLVLGAGGLGSPMLLYLAAAGVGRIGIVDDDAVELSNLQRQIIHGTASLGRSKVASAKETIAAINPEIVVEAHAQRLTAANAAALSHLPRGCPRQRTADRLPESDPVPGCSCEHSHRHALQPSVLSAPAHRPG